MATELVENIKGRVRKFKLEQERLKKERKEKQARYEEQVEKIRKDFATTTESQRQQAKQRVVRLLKEFRGQFGTIKRVNHFSSTLEKLLPLSN